VRCNVCIFRVKQSKKNSQAEKTTLLFRYSGYKYQVAGEGGLYPVMAVFRALDVSV
jgi:hypothetical protein